uniref:Uncharacterized protein n=1 Tax=mine drainage metagenome TaxID=410659 RepID=E6QIJ3_9ZZZZ
MKYLSGVLMLCCLTVVGLAQTPKEHTLAGYISDSKCGAMHMDNGIGCVKQCIENGNQPVLVDTQKHVWAVENPLALKGYYGDNVEVEARVNVDGKSIYVNKVTRKPGVMGGMKDGFTR